MPRKPCNYSTLAGANGQTEPACDMKAVARGLCTNHYEKARRLKWIEMEGTGKKGGRPTGPRLATPVAADVEQDPERSLAELRSLAKKLMWRHMTDPGVAMQERSLAIRLSATMEDVDESESNDAAFQEMIAKARGGLKSVE